jgi:hypothetical protein
MIYKVLSAKRYSFRGSNGFVEGCKVTYCDSPDPSDQDFKGLPVITISSPDRLLFDQFPVLPADYELEFRQKPGKDGKPVLTIASVLPVGK